MDGYRIEQDGDTWLVTNPEGAVYRVVHTASGRLRCSCPASRFRGECKHLAMVQERTMSEQQAKLATALAKAQKQVRAVPHDARNEYHRYNYTSSEAIIEASKDHLADNGLAVMPLKAAVRVIEGSTDRILACSYLLVHSSGEAQTLEREWPICLEKGRPLDKATAAAYTVALAYLLRDLLLMPRVDPEDEVSARDDRQHQPAQQPQPVQTISQAQLQELLKLLAERDADSGKMLEFLRIKSLADLPADKFEKVRDQLKGRPLRQATKTEGNAVKV